MSELMSGDGARDGAAPFLLAPGGLRLIEVQPTRRCNLRCLHCYSESGPERSGALAIEKLEGFLQEARALGYGYVGVSGGEPLLWDDLERFLRAARSLGYSTSVVTNGTLLTPDRAAGLRGIARAVAVSVDGPPEEHAVMRGSPSAFPLMRRGLSILREAGIRFTLVFTLTRHNADRLRWLYEFADEVGAAAVEIHPLAGYGAAAANLRDAIPGSLEFQVAAWLLALLAERRSPGGPGVILDAARRAVVERSGWPLLDGAFASARFCDLVPSLVVEPDGCVVPFIYGFPRHMSVTFVGRGPLADAVEEWRQRCGPAVVASVRSTVDRLAASGADYIDLFAEVLATALTGGRPGAHPAT